MDGRPSIDYGDYDGECLPEFIPSCYQRALDALAEDMLPVLLIGGDGPIEWHLFKIEEHGPGYDRDDAVREKFITEVSALVRYHTLVHEDPDTDCREYDDS